MATVQRGYRDSYMNSNRASIATTTTIQPDLYEDQTDDMFGEEEEEQYPTMFCRALYDYQAQDMSALSFRKGEIIEVLSQQPSGWWDGLLRDERGWFPSNYVSLITEEEADLAFSGSETENMSVSNSRDSLVDMSSAMMGGEFTLQEDTTDWRSSVAGSVVEDSHGLQSSWEATSPSDFWMPQVAPNGQVRVLSCSLS